MPRFKVPAQIALIYLAASNKKDDLLAHNRLAYTKVPVWYFYS